MKTEPGRRPPPVVGGSMRHLLPLTLVISVALLSLPGDCTAQEANAVTGLEQGDLVRISRTNDIQITGTLERATPDTLFVAPDGTPNALAVPTAVVRSIELGTRKNGAVRGALIGLGVGGAVGLSLGIAGCEGYDCAAWTGGLALALGLPAAGLGALIGSTTQTENWVPFAPDEVRITPIASNRGVGIGISLPVR